MKQRVTNVKRSGYFPYPRYIYFKFTRDAQSQNGRCGSWSSQSRGRQKTVLSPLDCNPPKRSAEELTCAGIVINPDVARMADAHEGAGGVNTHGVLPAVVLPLSALVNIWGENKRETRENKEGLYVVLLYGCNQVQLSCGADKTMLLISMLHR